MKSKQNQNTHIFDTAFGKILAFKENGILKAKNIRYAHSVRFKKPIPVEPSYSEIIFPEKTPVCPQNISPLLEKMIGKTNLADFEVDESPQYISIFRPETIQDTEKLSVMVWIHGGSYEIGCGDLSTADPTQWVKEQNAIIVAVSYRLGIFGFLGGCENKPANLGLFDLIEALKWIKTNIAAFGGDDENICLLGQSSGGDAIAHLMISDGIQGLFKRVIIQSAPLGLRKNRAKMAAEFLSKTKIYTPSSDLLEIIESYRNHIPSFFKYGLKAAMPFGTQYGFPPLCSESEAESTWKKAAGTIDVLIGLNDEETSFYLKASDTLNKYIPRKLLDRAVRVSTEIIYGKPAKEFADNFADAGGNIYLFRIHDRIKTGNQFLAAHAIDLPFMFGNESAWQNAEIIKNIPWNYIHENGEILRALWSEFAKTGKISDHSERPEILDIHKVDR